MCWKPFSIVRPPLAAVDNNLLWISLLFFCVACFDSLGIVVSPFTLLAVCFSRCPAFLCLTSFVHFARLQGSLNKHKMATRAWIRQQHDVCICSTCNIYTLHTLQHLPTHTYTHTHTHIEPRTLAIWKTNKLTRRCRKCKQKVCQRKWEGAERSFLLVLGKCFKNCCKIHRIWKSNDL